MVAPSTVVWPVRAGWLAVTFAEHSLAARPEDENRGGLSAPCRILCRSAMRTRLKGPSFRAQPRGAVGDPLLTRLAFTLPRRCGVSLAAAPRHATCYYQQYSNNSIRAYGSDMCMDAITWFVTQYNGIFSDSHKPALRYSSCTARLLFVVVTARARAY